MYPTQERATLRTPSREEHRGKGGFYRGDGRGKENVSQSSGWGNDSNVQQSKEREWDGGGRRRLRGPRRPHAPRSLTRVSAVAGRLLPPGWSWARGGRRSSFLGAAGQEADGSFSSLRVGGQVREFGAMTLNYNSFFGGQAPWRGDGRRAGGPAATARGCRTGGRLVSRAVLPFRPRVAQTTRFSPARTRTFPRPGPK